MPRACILKLHRPVQRLPETLCRLQHAQRVFTSKVVNPARALCGIKDLVRHLTHIRHGTVLGKGHDRCLTDGEGAHAEQQAIAEARKALNTEDLSGCILYTTAEPCTECLLACRAANIDFVRYGCTMDDCAEIGLETDLGEGEDAQIPRGYLVCSDRNACLRLFALYSERKAAG